MDDEVYSKKMPGNQQRQGQHPTDQTYPQNQHQMTTPFGASASQNQLSSTQGKARVSTSQHMEAAASTGASLQMNSNGVMATQYLNMQSQPKSNEAAMNEIPQLMNGQAPGPANYNIPRMSNWISGQPLPPQSNAQYHYSPSGFVSQNGFGGNLGQDSMLQAISPKSAVIPIESSNHVIRPDSSQQQPKKEKSGKSKEQPVELSSAAKAKQNRERNREHARSTRQRKKAYVQQLKEMAEGLRAIQTEEIRQRRTAVQKRMGDQKVRRVMIQTALEYHASFECDPLKWTGILEESFCFKQPVTPFRSFRRSEVEKDCRILRGIEAMICESASLSVMVERIGCRSARWQQIKGKKLMDRLAQSSRLSTSLVAGIAKVQQAESSLSSESSTGSSNGSSSSRAGKRDRASPRSACSSLVRDNQKEVSSFSTSSNYKKAVASNTVDESDDSKMTTPDPSLPTTNHSHAKRFKTCNDSEPRATPCVQLSGGVIHQVRSSNDSLGSQPRNHQASIPLSSYSVFADAEKEIGCYYAVNEDDMIIIEDILMCPFIFRSRNAVLCGALADCVMPGMLRANFSKANKIQNLEIIFDAMGFMQQLDGANGQEVNAQVIPGSLEMALMNCTTEARVITEARPPYSIVHVNEAWTRLMKYSQLEVEGQQLLSLIEGDRTDPLAGVRPGKPVHKLEEVAKGRPACSSNIHYDKHGNPFFDFMSSYPLTNASNEISHLLHVSLELPKLKAIP